MESPTANSKEKQDGIPADAVKIGDISLGEKPRASSFASNAMKGAGYVVSWTIGGLSRDVISDVLKEDVTAHQLAEKDGIRKTLQKSLNRLVDLKLWKSNLAGLSIAVGGMFLTDRLVKKAEENNFKKKYSELPHKDQLDKILQGKFDSTSDSPQSDSKIWQDKVKESSESQKGLGVQ